MANVETYIGNVRGPQGLQGPKGDAFKYEDFTAEQLEALRGPTGATGPKGDALTWDDLTDEQKESLRGEQGLQGVQGPRGERGLDFTYDNFTPEQLESLRGPRGYTGETGATGATGERGQKGDAFKYEDFTEEQLNSLKVKGDKGDAFTYSDFTAEQLASLKGDTGEKGDAFTYSDFTEEQLAELKGATGAGVAVGGSDGDILVKSSSTDYATAWSVLESRTVTDPTTTTTGTVTPSDLSLKIPGTGWTDVSYTLRNRGIELGQATLHICEVPSSWNGYNPSINSTVDTEADEVSTIGVNGFSCALTSQAMGLYNLHFIGGIFTLGAVVITDALEDITSLSDFTCSYFRKVMDYFAVLTKEESYSYDWYATNVKPIVEVGKRYFIVGDFSSSTLNAAIAEQIANGDLPDDCTGAIQGSFDGIKGSTVELFDPTLDETTIPSWTGTTGTWVDDGTDKTVTVEGRSTLKDTIKHLYDYINSQTSAVENASY